MTASRNSGTTFLNARLSATELGSVRIAETTISGLGVRPSRNDVVIDLNGDWLLPGLINAHDHLQLNSLGTHEVAHCYGNVQQWIAELNARRSSDPEFAAAIAAPRDDRLLIGGIKNLLSGVTTVAHHDPLYPFLLSDDFPVRVARPYGWSHSLYTDGNTKVQESHRSTPSEWPWIVHAAEGLDTPSVDEFDMLDTLGCLGPNTLLVHGVALDRVRRQRLLAAGAGMIWCPSSNLRLFGATADIAELLDRDRVAIGTDSRLSGARDMLEELRIAASHSDLGDDTLTKMATCTPAALLRLPDRGSLHVGKLADMIILPAATPLSAASRADVKLVLIDGVVRYGDPELAGRFAPDTPFNEICVDGRQKVLDCRIANRLSRASLRERGLTLSNVGCVAA